MRLRENPLLRYQLFGFTVNRWKRQPLLYGAVAVGFGLAYLLVYRTFTHVGMGTLSALGLAIIVMCLAAPLMAYNLFSLEYEKQTWESLALTCLTAKEILWGKWGAALMRVGVLTLILTPLLLASYTPSWTYPSMFEDREVNTYTLWASGALLFTWGALLVSLGMWLSFKLKRTLSTASVLYAGQFFVLVLLPTLLWIFFTDILSYNDLLIGISTPRDGFVWWVGTLIHPSIVFYINPFYTSHELQHLADYYPWRHADYLTHSTGLYYVAWGFAQSLIYLALAVLFAGLTYRGLKIAWRK